MIGVEEPAPDDKLCACGTAISALLVEAHECAKCYLDGTMQITESSSAQPVS